MFELKYAIHPEYPLDGLKRFDLEGKDDLPIDLRSSIWYYAFNCEQFQCYEMPIIYKGRVLTHWVDVKAAQCSDRRTMQVVEVTGLEEEDIILFFVSRLNFQNESYVHKYLLFKELRKYLEYNPKGIAYAEEVKSKFHRFDINNVMAVISMCSASYIEKLIYIGDTDIYIFDKQVGFNEMYQIAKRQRDVVPPTQLTVYEIYQRERNRAEKKYGKKNKNIRPPEEVKPVIPEVDITKLLKPKIQINVGEDDFASVILNGEELAVGYITPPEHKKGKYSMTIENSEIGLKCQIILELPEYKIKYPGNPSAN